MPGDAGWLLIWGLEAPESRPMENALAIGFPFRGRLAAVYTLLHCFRLQHGEAARWAPPIHFCPRPAPPDFLALTGGRFGTGHGGRFLAGTESRPD